jgi:hypothetical protein
VIAGIMNKRSIGANPKKLSKVAYPYCKILYSGKNHRTSPVIKIKKPIAKKPIIDEKKEEISLKNNAFIT